MIKQKTTLDEYEINPCTMMISPTPYGSKTYSNIMEIQDDFLSPFRPIDIIKKSCQYFGSSFEGRIAGTKQLIGITHKVPITIDPTNSIYFFPTTSPQNSQCIWLAHEHVISHKRLEANKTLVTFRNKQSCIIPVSYSSFENQLLRTALLRTKLMQRIEESERKSFYLFRSQQRYMEASEGRSEYGDNWNN
jgi:competence protein ComK